ncbi:MAG: type II/IV secretion system protein [Campylobacteraceae bacterium]|jgi:type II secretory pathway pseudopilin PulG|nr:type II/IV secretion system protein [Campylobacteraceae bacterium]
MLNNRAFTLVELVFIIIAVGVLAAVIVPRMQTSRLREAADQVISHIRYTQHLAMIDDKFDIYDDHWYRQRWQIIFESIDGSQSYTIFADTSGAHTGTPSKIEVVKNPQNPSKLLSGAMSGLKYEDKETTKEMNLGHTYGIKNVIFSNTCSVGGSRRIIFDYIGRPMKGRSDYDSLYPNNSLITQQCNITLVNDSENITISVEPETGFAWIVL